MIIATVYCAAPLTSISDVEKFLGDLSNFEVVEMIENEHAKPGGVLYKKFMAARERLPSKHRATCLAFHGTPAANIPKICKEGFDPKRRNKQMYGEGEYFAVTPDIPLKYCGGGKKMLLNELLLGEEEFDHKRTENGIIVMKNPDHDLPRFVITFKKKK